MMARQVVRPMMLALAAVAATASACAPLDQIVLPGGQHGTVLYGEVRSVDSRRGRLEMREEYGRNHTVRFDNRTRVSNGSRQYPLSSLRRGDLVRVRVSYDRNGSAWADHVEVRHGGADRRTAGARVERLDGRVTSVDQRRGVFAMSDGRQNVVVHVGSRLSNNDARRFDRLRRGDRVRVEVRYAGRGQAELVRFR